MTNQKILKNNKNGFALLFSVLVSSLLLTIGLSIFSITLKELSISTSARQSIYAFFAADSGREEMLYRDLKLGNVAFSPSFDPNQITGINSASSTTGLVTGNLNGPNYKVTIKKTRSAGNPGGDITTVIESRGYDSDSDDKVERAIEQIY